jgi:pantetheine-phosphate adenylyltransferase
MAQTPRKPQPRPAAVRKQGDLRVGLYPGTFDPLTFGHIDIITRAAKLVDRLVIGVAINRDKGPLFTLEERVRMVERAIADLPHKDIQVRPFDTLLVKFAADVGANAIVRGLRAVSDFEYEFQMVGMNLKLAPEIETLFLMADPACQAIASRLVKEVARLGGDVSHFVPPDIEKLLRAKFRVV